MKLHAWPPSVWRSDSKRVTNQKMQLARLTPIMVHGMLIAASLTLAATSATLAHRELMAARVDPGRGHSAVVFWSAPTITLPIDAGSRQQRRLLNNCLNIIASHEFPFHAAEVQSALTRNCAEQARHTQARGMALAEVPTVLAVEARQVGDRESVRRYLSASHQLAPTDLSLVLHRIRIGFSTFSREELAEPGGLLEKELPVLIGSRRGVSIAASLYVQAPEIRPILERLAEDLPAIDRERFLAALRSQVRD